MDIFDTSDPRPLHFMGVGGAGMNPLAVLALRSGVRVTGCDIDPAGLADVAASGIAVYHGHDPAHLEGTRGVVVTAAVPPEHPELARARALGIPVVPRKQLLAALTTGRRVIGVAGTHGKTTTTVMVTEALSAAGLEPTGLAGGRVEGWGGNLRLGQPELYVVEADEYDQAFLELAPEIAVVTNVEADHVECYGSLDALEAAFLQFAGRAQRVIIGTDDPGAARLADRLDQTVWRYGVGAGDIAIRAIEQSPTHSTARLSLPGQGEVQLRLAVPGRHNIQNAAAALGVVAAIGAPIEPALSALERFSGVGRRFEHVAEAGGVTVVDDYAHHPTEIRATLEAARQRFPGRRLVAVFQPHLYSRTAQLGSAMGEALAGADVVVVTEVYAARERPMDGVSGLQVAEAVERAGTTVVFEADRDALPERVRRLLTEGDVLLTLGAGDITRLGRDLVAWLAVA